MAVSAIGTAYGATSTVLYDHLINKVMAMGIKKILQEESATVFVVPI